ncbi:MAG: hypothetical protein ABSH50_00650 [Bryobacteraceae bacterium]|jgi:hypothetical protein
MAKVVDPQNYTAPSMLIPGLKPPVWDFSLTDDGDPAEVEAFHAMTRELRDQDANRASLNRRLPMHFHVLR